MVMSDLRAHFRLDLLKRLDETTLFKPLSKDNIDGIIKLIIADLNRRLANKVDSLGSDGVGRRR